MLVLQMIAVDLKAEIKTISHDKRDAFRYSHENAVSYKINGSTTNKGSLYNFEQRLKRIKVLVVHHVQDFLQSVSATYREKSLFTPAQPGSGAVSQDANLRADRRLHALLAPILADNLLEPSGTEEQDVLEIVLKENNLKTTSTIKPKDFQKIRKEVMAYRKSLTRMCELVTHYILYAFGKLCNPQTVDQLKVQQQQHFLS